VRIVENLRNGLELKYVENYVELGGLGSEFLLIGIILMVLNLITFISMPLLQNLQKFVFIEFS